MRLTLGGWEYGLTPETINNFRQNSPELVVRDAQVLLRLDQKQCEILRQILLARGVNKWLKARRDIIKLKNETRDEIKTFMKVYRKWNPEHKVKMKLLTTYLGKIRKICHQKRWVEWPKIADAAKAEKEIIIRGPSS